MISAEAVQMIDVRVDQFKFQQYIPLPMAEEIHKAFGHAIEVARGESPAAGSAPTIERVAQKVREYYGLDMLQLMGRSRVNRVAWARQVAMALSYQMVPNCTLDRVGQFFGKDHTTVLHAAKVVSSDMSCDTPDGRQKKTDVEEIKRRILG